jgi:predicted DNA-binding transcriptional regulator YafY
MNRTDRLFAITVLLQGRRRLRARDLAGEFGVTIRTIYRDVAALSESGVPIVSLPGQGYELMAGFTLPPLALTLDEAIALALGSRLLAAQARGRLPSASRGALDKIVAVLPDATREQVNRLTEIVDFFALRQGIDLDDPRLLLLQDAIAARRAVRLRYHSYSRDEVTERVVEPARLSYSGAWYLSGWCRLRAGPRDFRIERIDRLDLLDETFPRREAATTPPEPLTARVRFDGAVVRWVRERQHYAFVAEDDARDGSTVMTYRVDTLGELVPWLLSWGAAAEPLSPPELRATIRAEALRLAERLD